MRLIFSRDRAAQLDLLLRSLAANAPADDTVLVYRATTDEHYEAYRTVIREHRGLRWWRENHPGMIPFNDILRELLDDPDTVTFFCDDDVLYRPVPSLGADVLLADERVLTFSLRLGLKYSYEYAAAAVLAERIVPHTAPLFWRWAQLTPHDHGYPGSIDGHTFRTADILRMIDGQTIANPLMLETILAHRCSMLAAERPLMACYPEQALVGVPVNTVADDQRRPHGERFPQPADELNARFLAGERIDLGALDFSGVDGCLHEVPFVWTTPVRA